MELIKYIAIAAAVIVAVVFLLLKLQINRLKQQLEQLGSSLRDTQQQCANQQASIDGLHAHLEETQASLLAMHRVTQPLPEKFAALEGKLREQLQQDPQVKLYQKAAAMAKQGADAKEIASECDLPVAEASVLVAMHSK